MDVEQLNKDILSVLSADLSAQSFKADSVNPKYSSWTMDLEGYVRIDQRIYMYVPDSGDLQLHILCYFHDHPVSGHFDMNKTQALVCQVYTWPNVRSFVTDFCRSCTTCSRSKAKRHKPYGLLKQLPVPTQPWNSISMDFIEQLPPSSDNSYTAILVVVDCFTKQSIFIPTFNTITSAQLAELFVVHVFSKHSIPSHVTSDHGSKFVSHFFWSLSKALDMKLHFTSRYHPEGDGDALYNA